MRWVNANIERPTQPSPFLASAGRLSNIQRPTLKGSLLLGICISLLSMTLPYSHAEETGASPDKLFVEGSTAYDEGRYADAGTSWEAIVDQALVAAPVFYNLGNAYFKQGDFPRAALYYLRAKTLSPRDTEVSANLDFTFQQINAPMERYPLWQRAVQMVSRQEWRMLATASYWLCALSIMLIFFLPRFRGPCTRIALALGSLTLVSLLPLLIWSQAEQQSEVMILQATPARYAPLDNAAVHYQVPKGSLARLLDQNGEWLKIRSGDKDAWVQRKVAQPVYPLNSLPSS